MNCHVATTRNTSVYEYVTSGAARQTQWITRDDERRLPRGNATLAKRLSGQVATWQSRQGGTISSGISDDVQG